MLLITILTFFTALSIIFGEFGQFPFGNTTFSLGITEILLIATLSIFFVWRLSIKKSIFIPKPFIIMMVFWAIGFLSLVLNSDLRGVFYLFRFILYSSLFLIGYFIIKDYLKFDFLIKTITLVALILSVSGILQFIFYPDITALTIYGFDPHQGRLLSTFLDPNFLGIFLSIVIILQIPFLARSRYYKVCSIINFIALFLTFSRSGYLTLLTGALIFGIFYRRIFLIPILLFVLSLYIFIPQFTERINGIISIDKSASERLISWDKGYLIFKESPMIGIGFNNLRFVLTEKNLIPIYSSDGGHGGSGIDSSLLFVLATTGIIGLSLYLSFWAYTGYIAIKSYRLKKDLVSLSIIAMIFGVFIGCQFINGLFFPSIMLLLFLLLGGYFANQSK